MDRIVEILCFAILGFASLFGIGWGFFSDRKYRKERDKKVNTLLESAHELAKKEVRGKSLESLTADVNELYPSTRSDDSESK
jgi:hypothetical protein